MRVVYVAGPFRAPTPWGVEENVRRAERAALDVWLAGAAALCPHANTRFFDKLGTDALWIAGTTELLRRCDAIYLQGEWQRSAGSRDELFVALERRLPVFLESPGSFWDWAASLPGSPEENFASLVGSRFRPGALSDLKAWVSTGIDLLGDVTFEEELVSRCSVSDPALSMDPERLRMALSKIVDLCGGDEDMDCVAAVADAALEGRELP